jgi:hypothetical protein
MRVFPFGPFNPDNTDDEVAVASNHRRTNGSLARTASPIAAPALLPPRHIAAVRRMTTHSTASTTRFKHNLSNCGSQNHFDPCLICESPVIGFVAHVDLKIISISKRLREKVKFHQRQFRNNVRVFPAIVFKLRRCVSCGSTITPISPTIQCDPSRKTHHSDRSSKTASAPLLYS